jgi:hypothetical protein
MFLIFVNFSNPSEMKTSAPYPMRMILIHQITGTLG